jgi:hypothetical protein
LVEVALARTLAAPVLEEFVVSTTLWDALASRVMVVVADKRASTSKGKNIAGDADCGALDRRRLTSIAVGFADSLANLNFAAAGLGALAFGLPEVICFPI